MIREPTGIAGGVVINNILRLYVGDIENKSNALETKSRNFIECWQNGNLFFS